MAATETVGYCDPSSMELRFRHTVDRTLVHRAAVSEVFVTDVREAGGTRVVVGAQLPLTHCYYNDHVQRPAMFDPMLLLEVGRQAAICGSHLLGVPLDTVMLLNAVALRIDDPDALAVGRRPAQLRVANHFEATRVRATGGRRRELSTRELAGRVRRGVALQDLSVGYRRVGSIRIEVQFLTPNEYAAVRGTTAAQVRSTADLDDAADARALPPHRVGRVHPANVVLAEARHGGGGVSARVAPRFGNRALFDHDYDHLPAMTLAEAARQLALLSVDDGTGRAVEATRVTGVAARFHRFAELDRPVLAATRLAEGGPPRGPVTQPVSLTQGDATVAEATVTLEPARSAGNPV